MGPCANMQRRLNREMMTGGGSKLLRRFDRRWDLLSNNDLATPMSTHMLKTVKSTGASVFFSWKQEQICLRLNSKGNRHERRRGEKGEEYLRCPDIVYIVYSIYTGEKYNGSLLIAPLLDSCKGKSLRKWRMEMREKPHT